MLQFHYELTLEFKDLDNEAIDINYCTFFRFPIVKTASFCIIKCTLPQLLVQELIKQVSDNEFPEIKLRIYLIDELSSSHDKVIDCIYDRTMLCLSIYPEDPLNFTKNGIFTRLILTHPILYYLSNNNTYNTILENTTAYNAVKSFESWLTENHGDLFDFQHFAHTESRNEYQYEHILVRSKNDLNVPIYLINNYKTNQTPCWYFFDDFNITKNNNNEIVCQYINIEKLSKQNNYKIEEYADSLKLTKILNEIPFTDFNKIYNDEGVSFVYNTNELKYNHFKVTSSNIPKKKSSTNSITLNNRQFNVSKNKGIQNKTLQQSSSIANLYVPDNIGNALARFNSCKDVIKNKIIRFVNIETTNAMINFPTFGVKYDIEKSGKYNYTPLSIVNCFIRKGVKENFCNLINFSLMINFKD